MLVDLQENNQRHQKTIKKQLGHLEKVISQMMSEQIDLNALVKTRNVYDGLNMHQANNNDIFHQMKINQITLRKIEHRLSVFE